MAAALDSRNLRAENEQLRVELQLAVDNACNAYFWDGHGERVWKAYGIQSDAAPAPENYKPGGSRDAERERGGGMKYEIKHRFSGGVLFSLECESLKVCVEVAVKSRANLSGANLSGADLGSAYLGGANLSGANLGSANLSGADVVANLGQPAGWYAWTYVSKDGLQRVRVGCRDLTLADGRAYWGGKDNRREVIAALDYAEALGKLRGWKQESA